MSKQVQAPTHLDALRLADALRERMTGFAQDNLYTSDARLSQISGEFWSGALGENGLLGDLWVEGAFPAERSADTLDSLATEGLFSRDLAEHLDQRSVVPIRRPLYSHQAEAIRRARDAPGGVGSRPALVVSAGTGAGKTESFLLPILDDLQRHPSDGKSMRCLILYPMNALVNDQVDRLYEWLRGQTALTLFHFTSETPEDNKKASDLGLRVDTFDPCRFRTRQHARGLETASGRKVEDGEVARGPCPDIVVTNYSMLEYMLCRPQDQRFFGPGLRAVVLDEAHLYTGTLAAEITLLLRRLYQRCGVDPERVLQIATSATLGGEGPDELQRFASTLFSKRIERVVAIEGGRSLPELASEVSPATEPMAASLVDEEWLTAATLAPDPDDHHKPRFVRDTGQCESLRRLLLALTAATASKGEDRPAVLLAETLAHSPKIHQLQRILFEKGHMKLDDLACELWGLADGVSRRATTVLLQLAASARREPHAYPLVPHRLHLLARPASGLSVCLDPECTGPEGLRLPPFGTVLGGMPERCPHCDKGRTLTLARCQNCGEWMLSGELRENRYHPAQSWQSTRDFLTPHVEPAREKDPGAPTLTLGPDGSRGGDNELGIPVARVDHCPNCDGPVTNYTPFGTMSPLPLTILAEALLTELPVFPSANNFFLPARGRRLLAFSDSRQEAARLGPRLTRQHERQLVRSLLVEMLGEPVDEAALPTLKGNLRAWIDQVEVNPGLRPILGPLIAQMEEKVRAIEVGGDIKTWAEKLKDLSRITELLDADDGEHHRAVKELPEGSRSWGQAEWEKNRGAMRKRASDLLAGELATLATGAISAEKLGLAEITYPGLESWLPPATLLGEFPASVSETLSGVWPDLLRALIDTLRSEGAVTLGSEDKDSDTEIVGFPLGAWASREAGGYFLHPFVAATDRHRRRKFVTAVLRKAGAGQDEAPDLARILLGAAFDQLLDAARSGSLLWLGHEEGRQTKDGATVAGLRLIFEKLALRRPATLFRCAVTGHLWPRSVLGCAPEDGCEGTLKAVADAELKDYPRFRRLRDEYESSPVFRTGLWAEEHSAQLAPQENRRLQDLFKAGIRNILSATTTLELGIDIGGLTAVLLGNVPPGKANYL
jgi:DEAD/DEAH box helicase domain-containing protein